MSARPRATTVFASAATALALVGPVQTAVLNHPSAVPVISTEMTPDGVPDLYG